MRTAALYVAALCAILTPSCSTRSTVDVDPTPAAPVADLNTTVQAPTAELIAAAVSAQVEAALAKLVNSATNGNAVQGLNYQGSMSIGVFCLLAIELVTSHLREMARIRRDVACKASTQAGGATH